MALAGSGHGRSAGDGGSGNMAAQSTDEATRVTAEARSAIQRLEAARGVVTGGQ
jgi:hypothetical protein